MKKSFVLLVFIGLSILGMSYSNEKYPDWIPKDAIEAANNYWVTFNLAGDDESIKDQYGLSGRYDITVCELKYGYQIVAIDYDKYDMGKPVFDYFDITRRGGCQYAYGFAVYFNDIHIGEIEVKYTDNCWKLIGTRGFGVLKKRDWFEDMISSYPSSRGYHLYKEDMGIFFAVKDDSVNVAFTGYEVAKGLIESDPVQYVLQEKERRAKVKMMKGGLDE